MKSRQEIKALAKEAMGAQRSTGILAILILIAGALVSSVFALVPLVGWLFSLAISVLLLVLAVNVCGIFIRIYRREQAAPADSFSALGVNFARKWGGMFWMALWIWLWSLLLIIPGIIKSYAYLLTPYILADCPNVTATDALKLSMRMTKGHKAELFVMHLSFIGWLLLGGLTLHILTIIFVAPYMETTMAGYYQELRDKALASGTISAEELQ